MFSRSMPLVLAMLAPTLFVVQLSMAHDKAEGTFVSAAQGKLSVTIKGTDNKLHTHDVTKDGKITLDGKPAKLADLKAGFHVKVTLGEKHVITSIDALSAHVGPQAASAQEKSHDGIVVKAGEGKLTMTGKGSDKEHTMNVAKDAKITIDGKPAHLGDLKKGFHIKVSTHSDHGVVKIDAHSKENK